MKYQIFLQISFLLAFLFLLVSTTVALDTPVKEEISLLSVKQLDNGSLEGEIASMTIEVRQGSGLVYIQSFPTSQVDTQTSTRIANEVACDLSSVSCSRYDFFYTIETGSSLIGGPSAGAATALLTFSILEDIPLPDDIAMTGAITSGGIVIPVSGIEEKVEAAQRNGFSTVYIPSLSKGMKNGSTGSMIGETTSNTTRTTNVTDTPTNRTNKSVTSDDTATNTTPSDSRGATDSSVGNTSSINTTNTTRKILSLKERLDNMTIDVVYVSTVFEAMEHASDSIFEQPAVPEIEPPDQYTARMNITARELCSRTRMLLNRTTLDMHNVSQYTSALDFRERSKNASENKRFYSQASYCYTANLRLQELLFSNKTSSELNQTFEKIEEDIERFEQSVDKKRLWTFSDLETYVIVKERLLESSNYLSEINTSNVSSKLLAYATERYHSAISWNNFFGMDGQKLEINTPKLHVAATNELRNVQTRLNLLSTYLPSTALSDIRLELEQSKEYLDDDYHALSLFKASKAKAQADLFLSSMTLENGRENELLNAKTQRTKQLIAEQQGKGRFPILGYSYMEYSREFVSEDPFTSLLFGEYGLQLSDLARYFPEQDDSWFVDIDYDNLYAFIGGFVTAVFSMLLIFLLLRRYKRSKRSSKRKRRKKHKIVK
ncbi:MAG: S16 family serine protease [Nanoarchaeota archaeon]